MDKNSGSSDVSPGAPDQSSSSSRSRTSTPVTGSRKIPLSNGRTPPSKWDDAERWIRSPVPVQGPGPPGGAHRRQVKSKSGPLGGPGAMHPSNVVERRSFVEGGGHGALVPRELFTNNNGRVVRKQRSLDDEKLDDVPKEVGVAPSKTDDHTNQPMQLSHHKKNKHLSSNENLSLDNGNGSTKDEVWDIQVDESITSTPELPKEQEPSATIKKSYSPSSNYATKASRNTSKSRNKEVEKITNWENLQKTKAEEAIQKLEMKLEKERSTSTEKIMNKLKESQRKAEVMRSTMESKSDYSQKARGASRIRGFICANAKACSTCDCFVTRR